jgi:hypothetical protein
VLKRNGESYTKTVIQLKPLDKLTPQHRWLIESITYTESGKPNLKLVSKEYCHRELRKMLGGDAPQSSVLMTSVSTRMRIYLPSLIAWRTSWGSRRPRSSSRATHR